ncbi:Glycerophosphodiester phosphodiesterase GDE1 isoform B [Micractinium conductrix]|uniref:glycerophosphodiester phosphodiesterase n=1 Tax=Micractinium conductrix TaxID=554055 RepID=A0A2P6V0I7_9CHLO|nr:Glycerophosphodiester phosphodiesterase GDE1 isoform B [Micractinium conductrix]|eukprot:PSC67608.1 Glycerophosphodiester phosphodiesterase GDE1 isoform B [Micractinium conductrix]
MQTLTAGERPQAAGPEPGFLEWDQSTRFAGLLDAGADTVVLGGHRGMGANAWHPSAPTPLPAPYRENTLASFQRAVQCGASFLEFDVQITKDGVPIVWHDNYVVFGAEAAPTSRLIAELTAEEFRQLAPINATSAATLGGGAAAAGGEEGRGDADEELLGSSPTFSTASTFSLASLDSAFSGMSGGSTLSLGGMSAASSSSALSGGSSGARRLLRKHRNGEPAVAHEPTLRPWACEVEDHFPTLAEVFAAIPPSVAFDIEIKMATPNDLAVTPPAEVERMVSATLAAVEAGVAAYGPRLVLFSSFDPDVCLEVKRRRPDAPVMFLSGGGVYAHADPRRTSIPAALDVAATGGLQGVILNALALQASLARVGQAHGSVSSSGSAGTDVSPCCCSSAAVAAAAAGTSGDNWVAAARARGLAVLTYGLQNDDPAWVRQQWSLGVHGVIVDDVAGVAAALAATSARC